MRSALSLSAQLTGALLALHSGALGQQAARSGSQAPASPAIYGTVTGHVICSDTNLPARFAKVVLQPVVAVSPVLVEKKEGGSDRHESMKIVETGLDGSFTIAKVRPGDYYVIAEKIGYRSPTEVTREEMDRPTEAVARRMAALLTPVSVAANRGSTAEVRLLRGASIAGAARFDDGSVDAAATVKLWSKDKKGEWAQYKGGLLGSSGGYTVTNDQGQFRFSGLSAGEYLLSVSLEVSTVIVDRVNGGESESWYSSSNYTLNIFSPRGTRKKDAIVIKLTEQQATEGVDVEVPLSKLHTISGSLAEDGTGRNVNAGRVALAHSDDGSELASVNVSGDDDSFHLNFVPEGEYTVKVTKARDVIRQEIPNAPGMTPPTHTEEKTIRSFADASQPLIVTSDVSGLIVSVPAVATKTSAAQ